MTIHDDRERAYERAARDRRVELLAVPGVREALTDGFMPLHELTGDIDLAGAWPRKHLRIVRDTRRWPNSQWVSEGASVVGAKDLGDEESEVPAFADGRVYLVRSPWSSIDLVTVLKLAQRWRRRNERSFRTPMDPSKVISAPHGQPVLTTDTDALRAVDQQFFAQNRSWVRAYGRGRVDRLT